MRVAMVLAIGRGRSRWMSVRTRSGLAEMERNDVRSDGGHVDSATDNGCCSDGADHDVVTQHL